MTFNALWNCIGGEKSAEFHFIDELHISANSINAHHPKCVNGEAKVITLVQWENPIGAEKSNSPSESELFFFSFDWRKAESVDKRN